MPIRVLRNPKESTDRLIARFNKKVQSSRILPEVKGDRYHVRKPKKRKVRAAAIMREMHRANRERQKFY